jgi:phosphoglycolate phosphatase-like HAD superfamily hydrolase
MARARAVIFDLDEALLRQDAAWRYTIEEAVAGTLGERISAAGLIAEYRGRPWRHAVSMFVREPRLQDEAVALCDEIYRRSALKKLLVFDGLGMALDELRGARIEMAAISRQDHALARKQVESTGLERFIAALSASAGEPWLPGDRITDCLRFLNAPPGSAAFIGSRREDFVAASALGLSAFSAAWAGDGGWPRRIGSPRELVGILSALG